MTDDAIKMAAEPELFACMDEPDPVRRAALHCSMFVREGEKLHKLTGLGESLKVLSVAWLAANDQTLVDMAWMERLLSPTGCGFMVCVRSGILLLIDEATDEEYLILGRTRAEVLGLLTWLRGEK